MKLTLNEEIIKDYTGMFRCKPDFLILKYLPSFSHFVFKDNIKDIDQFQFTTDSGYNFYYNTKFGYFYSSQGLKQGIWPSFKINNSSDFKFNDGQVINYCGFRWVIVVVNGKNPKYYAFKSEPIMEGGKIKDFSQEPALETALQLWAGQNGIGKFDKNKIQNIPQATDSEKIISLLAAALNNRDVTFYPTSYFKPFSEKRLSVKQLRPYIESNNFQALFEAASCINGVWPLYSTKKDDIEAAFADVLGVYVESPKLLSKNILTLSQYLSFSDSQKKTLFDMVKVSRIVFDSFTPDKKYFYCVYINQPDVIRKTTYYQSGAAFYVDVLDYNSIRYLNLTDGEPCRLATSDEIKVAIGKVGSKYFLARDGSSTWEFSYYDYTCGSSSGTDELIDYPNAVVC